MRTDCQNRAFFQRTTQKTGKDKVSRCDTCQGEALENTMQVLHHPLELFGEQEGMEVKGEKSKLPLVGMQFNL